MCGYKTLYFLIGIIIINLLLLNDTANTASFYVNDNSTTGDRYCSAVGNDANSGATPASPTRTITNLVNKSNLGPGDIIYVDTGTYNERVIIRSSDQGSSISYLTFKGVASGGTNSLITGSGANAWNNGCITLTNVKYVKIDSFYLRYNSTGEIRGIYSKSYCTNLLIINNIVVSNQLDGIKLERTYYSTVSNNKCRYNDRKNWDWPSGIMLGHHAYSNTIIDNRCSKNGTGTAGNGNGIRIEEVSHYNIIKGNICQSNYNKGIQFRDEGAGTENRYNTIRDNIISYNSSDGIGGEGYPGTDANKVINNRCHHNGIAGISFYWNGDSSDDNIIISNTSYSNKTLGIHVDGKNNFLSYNLCYSNGSHGIEIKGDGPNTNIFSVCYKNGGNGLRMTSDAGKSLIRNCTLFKNNGDGFEYGGGGGNVDVRNCISVSNGAYGYRRSGNTVTLTYSESYGNTSGDYFGITVGTGCVTASPVFISITFGQSDFLHLSNISPCIDTGDPDDPVPQGGNVCIDMGRYEYIYTNTAYYVNDSSQTGDIFCTAIGSDANSGTTPASPKATITNLLITYSLKPGNFVYVDTGRYDDKITVTTNDDGDIDEPVIFLGAGNTRTIMSNSIWAPNIFFLRGENSVNRIKGVKITHFQFIGGDECIKFEKSSHCLLANCKILRYNTSGVLLWGTNDNIKVTNNYIKGRGVTRAGIFIGDSSSTNIITKNSIIYNNDAGIYLSDWGTLSSYNTLSFNNISSNSNGLLVLVPHNTIISNEIYYCSQSGIKFDNAGRTNSISGNEIYNIYGSSMDKSAVLIYRQHNTITNNNIHHSSNGIIIKWDGCYNTIEDNEIHDCNKGIALWNDGNARSNCIRNNKIYTIRDEGMNVFTPYNTIISNTIYAIGDGIKLDMNGRTNTVSGNDIYSAYVGIRLFREYNTITNNKIHNLHYGIIMEWDAHHNSIMKNELYNNTLDGILKGAGGGGAHYNTFFSNKIHHNGTQGISFCYDINNYNRFVGNKIWGNWGIEGGMRIDGECNSFLYNTCYSNKGSGIMVNCNNSSVTNKFNKCYHNQTNGIYIIHAVGGVVISNILYTNSESGLYCKDSDSLLIVNNIITSNFDGITFADNSDNNLIFKNIISRNKGKGIELLNNNCNNNSIINNVLFKNSSYGIDIDNIADTVIKNVITMSNLKGINKSGASQSITYCCTNDGVNNAVGGIGCILDNPLFYSTAEGNANFRLKWNSPCIGTGEPNPIAGCMGVYPQYNSIDIPVISTKSKHTVTFTTLYSNGLIPNNGKIDIRFPAGFTLNNTSFYTTTSSWGGNPGNFSTSRAGQTITVTRSGGNDSYAGQVENLVLTNIINPNTPGGDYKLLIETRENSGTLIEMIDGNYFCIVSNTMINIEKLISSVKLNGVNEVSIPGATIDYCIKASNYGVQPAWNIVVYDKISDYIVYKTNSSKSTNNWTAEFSTNLVPDQSYNSTDYTDIEPSSIKVKWLRWKAEYLESSEKDILNYNVIIK